MQLLLGKPIDSFPECVEACVYSYLRIEHHLNMPNNLMILKFFWILTDKTLTLNAEVYSSEFKALLCRTICTQVQAFVID